MSLFVFLTVTVVVIGLVRVLRVLYRNLWKPALCPVSDVAANQAVAISQWSWCSGALLMNGLLASIAMIIAFVFLSIPRAGRLVEPPLLEHRWLTVPMYLLLWIGFGIALGALLARPTLRSLGHRLGRLTATASILVLPLSLITFPAGLAAWILLTSPPGRDLFRLRGESGEATSTTAN